MSGEVAATAADRCFLDDMDARLQAALALVALPARGVVSVSFRLPGIELDGPPPDFDDCAFLSRPDRGETRLGIGHALRLSGVGSGRMAGLGEHFEALRADWPHLDLDGCGALPGAFAGLAFDPRDGAFLCVPRLLLQKNAETTVLTLSALAHDGPPDRMRHQWMSEVRRLFEALARQPVARSPTRLHHVAEAPDFAGWVGRVDAVIRDIRRRRLEKVVLGRQVTVCATQPFDHARLAALLARRHPNCAILAFRFGQSTLLAATPERLAALRGGQVESDALAGTCRRDADPERDAELARQLRLNAKDLHEHRLVVEWIANGLAEVCREIGYPCEPELMTLPLMHHLWTPVTGRVGRGCSLLDVVDRLHPTPAVAGWPTREALMWLGGNGERRPSWYTGAMGWLDSHGEGEFWVVLRSAMVTGATAELFAGAGIVEGSDPEAEFAETELKLRTMLEALRDA